jgi:tetratricopeptide (TPR) repeat protein
MNDFYADYAANSDRAFAGATDLFPTHLDVDKITPDDVGPFVKGALSNARDCQNWIFATLSALRHENTLPRQEREYRQLLLRRLLDGIAFRLFAGNADFLAGLVREKRIRDVPLDAAEVALNESNRRHSIDPYSFSIVSDLTTFVHVGDLLNIEYSLVKRQMAVAVIELKSGATNEKLLEIIMEPDRLACPYRVSVECSRKEIRQLLRMLKQQVTMFEVGQDLDGIRERQTLDDLTRLNKYLSETYSDLVNQLCDTAVEHGRAAGMVERGIMIGAAFDAKPKSAQTAALEGVKVALQAADHPSLSTGTLPDQIIEEVRTRIGGYSTLLSCDPFKSNLTAMVGIPFTSWHINPDHIQRLVQERLVIRIGIDPARLLWLLRDHGIAARLSTRKETARYRSERTGDCRWLWNNRMLLIDEKPPPENFFRNIINDLVAPLAALDVPRNGLCLCGSGLKYKHCCVDRLPGHGHLGSRMRAFLSEGKYRDALYASRADVTQYTIWHKTHTEPAVRRGMAKEGSLLEIDIRALGDLVDDLMYCHMKANMMNEFPGALERLRRNIDDPDWQRKITYFHARHALWPDWNKAFGRHELSKLGSMADEKDEQILKLYLDLLEDDLTVFEKLEIIDRILTYSETLEDQLHYRGAKAALLLANGESSKADDEWSAAIAEARERSKGRALTEDERYSLAQIIEFLGTLRSADELLSEALQLYRDQLERDDWTSLGRANIISHMADIYRHFRDWESARDSYLEALAVNPRPIYKVFLSKCLFHLGQREEALKTLGKVDHEQLTAAEKLDYTFTLASAAIETNDRNHLESAKDMLTALQITEPLFREQRDSLLLDVREALGSQTVLVGQSLNPAAGC